jgi:hypothetical protein
MLKGGAMHSKSKTSIAHLIRLGVLSAAGTAATLLSTGEAAAQQQSGRLERSGLNIGQCPVGRIEVSYSFMLFGGPAVGGGLIYWEPAGGDCSFEASLMFEVEHAGRPSGFA